MWILVIMGFMTVSLEMYLKNFKNSALFIRHPLRHGSPFINGIK